MNREDLLSLKIYAETFEDYQRARISAENRLRSGQVDAAIAKIHLAPIQHAEHQMALDMRREYRRVVPPAIRQWQVETQGIGEHLLARLLAVIGDPAIAYPHHWESPIQIPQADVGAAVPSDAVRPVPRAQSTHRSVGRQDEDAGGLDSDVSHTHFAKRILVPDQPYARSLHQLWQYCGHGDSTARRKAGMKQEDVFRAGNPRAKMLVHLLAESGMKNRRSPYRAVYETAREQSATVHPDWTPMHSHNDGLRRVGKEILRDLWLVALGFRENLGLRGASLEIVA